MTTVRKIGRLIKALILILITFVLICNIYIIGVRVLTGNPQPTVFGWTWSVVVSGSMEPEIKVNDLVIADNRNNYEIGDIILFIDDNNCVAHRIIDKTVLGYVTKGDNNDSPDQTPVDMEDIVGKVVMTIPHIGLIIEYLRTPLGMTLLIIAGIVLLQLGPKKDE